MKLIATGAPRKLPSEIRAPSWFSKSNDGIDVLRWSGASHSLTNAEADRGADAVALAVAAHSGHGSVVLPPASIVQTTTHAAGRRIELKFKRDINLWRFPAVAGLLPALQQPPRA